MSLDFIIPEDFKAFDCRGQFWNYERNLPHWRQPGTTYFLTFRLNDSLPQEVIEEVQREREFWEKQLISQSEPDKAIQDEYAAWQRRTWHKMESVMDQCHGSCVLRNPEIRQIVANALLFFEGERSKMYGFVIMPNHVHLAAMAMGNFQIEEVLKSWKGFSSRAINKALDQKGTLWQGDNWNRIIRNEAHWQRVMRYIFRNPEKARLREDEFTTWFATSAVERVFQPVVRENSGSEDEPW